MMGGRRLLREQTVVTLDHDVTNLVSSEVFDDFTNLVEFTKFADFTNLIEAEHHLKNNGRPEAAP